MVRHLHLIAPSRSGFQREEGPQGLRRGQQEGCRVRGDLNAVYCVARIFSLDVIDEKTGMWDRLMTVVRVNSTSIHVSLLDGNYEVNRVVVIMCLILCLIPAGGYLASIIREYVK